MNSIRIGVDLAKQVFQLHGVDRLGNVTVRRQLRRAQMHAYFKDLPPCLIGMEACGSSHYWGRVLSAYGHSVKLMAPQFVKPYVKSGIYGRYNNNDFGMVRNRTKEVPDLEMGPDGKPTAKSWEKMQEALNKIGKGTEAYSSCFDGSDADKINKFAEQRMNDPKRAPYSWNPLRPNTCTTFAGEAIGAGYK